MTSSRDEHCSDVLGAYVLGALDDEETRRVDTHLADCSRCRAEATTLAGLKDVLGEVPPEAFLDGPPTDGHLLLQRTLRQVRSQKRAGVRTRTLLVSASAVVAVAAAVGGGVLLGRATDAPAPVALPPVAGRPPAAAGVMHLSGRDGGAQLAVTITPSGGWVKVSAWVAGIPAGQKCQLVVVSMSGRAEVAGSWQMSDQGATHGVTMRGAALVNAHQVRTVEVEGLDGTTFVSASS
jgi:anti-sigma factor RsiW